MSLTVPVLSAFIAGTVAVTGVVAQLIIAYLARKQITKQLDLQHLVSHRSTASFIADKRQKWIDELRTDMAFHLALSQEIIWKWDAMRARTDLRVNQEATNAFGVPDQIKAEKIKQEAADAFSPENGARDREHQERHTRIMFRLNPKEELHIMLRGHLINIRSTIGNYQRIKTPTEAESQLKEMLRLIGQAQMCTESILGAEWRRVKQEVAYPEVLMSTIPKPNQGN